MPNVIQHAERILNVDGIEFPVDVAFEHEPATLGAYDTAPTGEYIGIESVRSFNPLHGYVDLTDTFRPADMDQIERSIRLRCERPIVITTTEERMLSLNIMIKKIAGLAGTTQVTSWENGFIESIVESTGEGKVVSMLTEDQIEKVEQIHATHFA